MKIFDWQDIPMYGQNVQDVYDELFYRSEKQVWKHKMIMSLWMQQF